MFKTALAAAPAFARLTQQAAASKQYLQAQRALMVAATCDAGVPLSVVQHLAQTTSMMTEWSQTPGIVEYAQAQYDDPSYNVVAEFTTMMNAMNAALTGLSSTFPVDGGGWLLYQRFQAGAIVHRQFTAAQLAAAVSLIDAVIASIE
jgi:hypothetical protein